jgi:hypothetical protein
MYTEQEVTNMQANEVDQIRTLILSAMELTKLLNPFDFGEYNKGFKMAEEIIVEGYCTMVMSHMDESDFEEMITNTLAYFATGLYDCEKISIFSIAEFAFEVKAWCYTPETHNNAGHWFDIWKFENEQNAEKCVAMLKDIGAELEKLHNN